MHLLLLAVQSLLVSFYIQIRWHCFDCIITRCCCAINVSRFISKFSKLTKFLHRIVAMIPFVDFAKIVHFQCM